ncbi:hypothetical protein [Paenibacillus hubeiensis]|uniref:hypothetical protein n=1 Tax=Paenibacillus hubeiensis TaxID=3077330 RepID=UPI0031BA6716
MRKTFTVGIHEKVYVELEQILQKLDSNLELKLFAMVQKDEESAWNFSRVKRNYNAKVSVEDLGGIDGLISKLGHNVTAWDENEDLFQWLLESVCVQDGQHQLLELEQEELLSVAMDEQGDSNPDPVTYASHPSNRILYPGQLYFQWEGVLYRFIYVASIHYVSRHLWESFYDFPKKSMLHMTLKYFFADYYNVSIPYKNNDMLQSKYNENVISFLHRMSRVYIGKIFNAIQGGEDDADASLEEDVPNPLYYMNTLIDRIEEISNKTYEGESPFGCMLLLRASMLGQHAGLINYVIRFKEETGISLQDGRRIRKLLEITNQEEDLYLISDGEGIYGIGRVNWGAYADKKLRDMVYKLEFKGLSSYELSLLRLGKGDTTDHDLVFDHKVQTFKRTQDYHVTPVKLLSVSFKNPELRQEKFDPESFERIVRSVFPNERFEHNDERIDKLGSIILEATQQQSGTMIVITAPAVATLEVKRLRKQSTPILRTELEPAYIKYLSAIDGAIYCDTEAYCHAIGVILDGVANENIGDSSRGARFNSAYRYLEHLKKEHKDSGCIIAIISEDGLVDLIPEPVTERSLRQFVRAYADDILDLRVGDDQVRTYDSKLQQASESIEIDPDCYFVPAEAWFETGKYLQASEYYEKGFNLTDQLCMEYRRNWSRALLRLYSQSEDAQMKRRLSKKMLHTAEYTVQNGKSELRGTDYNMLGLALIRQLQYVEDSKEDRYYLVQRTLEAFSKSIEMKKNKKDVNYYNRALLYQYLGRQKDALEDIIAAEVEKPKEHYRNNIMKLIQENPDLYTRAYNTYVEQKGEDWAESELGKQLIEIHDEFAKDDEHSEEGPLDDL